MKIDINGILLLAAIAGISAFFWLAPGDGLQAAPNVRMTTIDGGEVDLKELRGKPYMIVFWATDCPGCVKEIPHLNTLYNDFGKQGFQVIAIAMPHDELPLIRTMREQKAMNYEIVFDEDGTLAKAFGGVKLTPTNFLISPKGKIALQKIGEFDVDKMHQMISDMLKS
jgi:peroxiredoxin